MGKAKKLPEGTCVKRWAIRVADKETKQVWLLPNEGVPALFPTRASAEDVAEDWRFHYKTKSTYTPVRVEVREL